jgi:hypothetical protein
MKMRCISHIVVYSLILTILLVGVAGAVIPDTVTFTTSPTKEWIVANGADSATLSLKALNNTIVSGVTVGPVSGLRVEFSVNDTGLASVTPSVLVTDLDGMVTPQLFAKTKSGTVLVSAKVFYKEDDSNPLETVKNKTYTHSQKIDHDTPYAISYDNFPNGVVSVGEELPLTIRLRDYWGNVVENKNPATTEKITFSIQGSPGDLAVFKNGASWLNYQDVLVDNKGDFNTTLKVSTLPGYHSILVKPLDMPISGHPYYVRTIANGIPARIISLVEITPGSTGSASPDPYIEADGFSRYFITYTVFDKYDNPVSDRVLKVNTTIPGEEKFLPATTDLGEVKINYGPKDQVGQVMITAVSVDNSSAFKSDLVKFINSTATEMLLTANPEMMASRDSPGYDEFRADIIAKVVDENGNGVPGQSVSFAMSEISYGGYTYNITHDPELESNLEITDSDGYAYAPFRPGSFATDPLAEHYAASATGRCTITATWDSTPHSIFLTWKNYPYLSAETSVSPNVVNVTDNVTVTLRLKGDGWALQPNPIDVVLVVDRSGSMGENTPTKISSAQKAGKIFVSQMSIIRDQIGVVSYSGVYVGTETRVDIPLSKNFTSVNASLDSLIASGATETRDALKVSIDTIRAKPNPNPKAVKAIILLTDGNWNWNGTPLGRGTGWPTNASHTYSGSYLEPDNYRWFDGLGGTLTLVDGIWRCTDGEATNQNMTNYAKNSDVRLYMISFGSGLDSTAVDAMILMSTSTGGFYENAPDEAKLSEIYTRIAGELKTEASAETHVDLNYGMVNVNQQPVSDVFNYVSKNLVSTMNRTYMKDNSAVSIKGPYYYDQTADWNDKVLSFDVGTVKLNQVWETTYMLRVLKPGNIDVFGIGSKISFNNNTVTMLLPKTLITALPDMSTTGSENVTKTLTIDNLTVTQDGNLANLSVDIQIKPEDLNLNVMVDIYITDEDQHTTTWIKTVNLTPVVNGPMFITSIDISQFQLGKEYTFYVDFINKQPGTNPVYWAQLTSNRFVRLAKPFGKYILLQ